MVSIISFIYHWNSLTHCHFMWVNVKWCVTEFHKSKTLEVRVTPVVENRLRIYHACSRNITAFYTTSYQAASVNTDLCVFQCGAFSNLILCSLKLCVGQKPVLFSWTDRHDEPVVAFYNFANAPANQTVKWNQLLRQTMEFTKTLFISYILGKSSVTNCMNLAVRLL